ncbi:MAG: hypothetical protein QUS08_10370, partial [Methanothrix sp.]|nr:hypothetical protein [Methanothrix sp.]
YYDGGVSMSISGINAYLALSSLYGKETGSSDPLLEPGSARKTELYSALVSESSCSLFDTADLSGTADFFSRLQQLEQTDPDKYEEVVKKLAERLQSARGYAGQVFDAMIQKVAEGADITEVIMPSSSASGPYTSTGTSAGKVQELITEILSGLNTDD